MSLVRRQTFAVIAALFAANPVMACCFGGVANVAADDATHSPPCHTAADEFEAPNHSGGQQPCLDCCDSELAAPASDAKLAAPLASSEIHARPVLAASFPIALAEPVVSLLKTGPPGDPPRQLQTPLALKQRFLI